MHAERSSVRRAPRLCLSQLLVALMVAIIGMLALASPASAAEPSYLQTQAKAEGSTLTITSVLYTQQSQGIPGRQLTIRLSTGQETQATTGADGYVTATLTTNGEAGTVQVTASFAGDAQYAASQGQAAAAVQAAPTVKNTKISAKTPTTSVLPGDVITITGSLTLSDGTPVESGQVTVSAAGKEISPAGSTGTSGDFSLMAQIPEDAKPGKLQLTVSFVADAGLEASSTTLQVAVGAAASSTPDPSQEPSTKPSSTDTASSPATLAEDQATPTPSASPSAPVATSGTSAMAKQFLIGGIVLAFVFAGLLALAWVARTRAAMPRRGVERASFIDDDPEDDEQD